MEQNNPQTQKCYNVNIWSQSTPVEGLYFDYNAGFRAKFPIGNFSIKATLPDEGDFEEIDEEISGDDIYREISYFCRLDFKVFKDKKLVFEHKFDLKGKKVLIVLPMWRVIGDTLAWIPCVEEFQRRHQCEIYVLVSRELRDILLKGYPNLHFVYASEEEWRTGIVQSVPADVYATYHLGVFFKFNDSFLQCIPYQETSLQQVGANILGLGDFPETRPKIFPSEWVFHRRPIKEPYVCISYFGLPRQQWNNPAGWLKTVKHLKSLGYRVLCIDVSAERQDGPRMENIPYGCEDYTGNLHLQDRIDLLWHCDFFVGISSGLSWLAWSLGKPVVLISGFTLPKNEFYTPYRVISYHGCNGCWNDNRISFNTAPNDICPRHQGTDRQFECSRLITPEKVCNVIDRCIADLQKKKNAVR